MSDNAAASTDAIQADPAWSMDDLVSLCKRRGFVYPASEIYGGINGFWDYGPLGVQLKNNLRDHWWKRTVECPPIGPDGTPLQIVGLDSAIIQNPKTWIASGHVGGFSDPMQTCKQCKKLVRADHVKAMLSAGGWAPELGAFLQDAASEDDSVESVRRWAKTKAGKKLASGLLDALDIQSNHADAVRAMALAAANNQLQDEQPTSTCPHCAGLLTEPREFNLMFESYAGAVKDEHNKVYLRPETAQGIFLNYKNVLDTMRVKMPFGIAQIGKSFRNEVTPRNYIFRSREFEQMEMEWFCDPDEAPKWYEFWKQERMNWWKSLGIDDANLHFRDHDEDELAHYSKMCVDVEYRYPFTTPKFGELEGIAHRGCFDLTQHQEHSGVKLEYLDQAQGNKRYMANVIEPASGLTRAVLVMLCEAYTPDPERASKVYMKFPAKFAPIKAGIFPLVNKDGMPEIAQKLYLELREDFTCEYDAKQSIGKRYARMDEVGTPFCFTIDGQTKDDQTITVRHRDSLAQERISLDQVRAFLQQQIG